ncbi:MAG: 30S ribosomal protein S6 [Pirellulales bacterium]|nr:30S ribosomal protein S6 [Pirellulales bacterium]
MMFYEGMFILDPTKYSRDPEQVTTAIGEMITNAGGELLASRVWDERKLAYPIRGFKKGVYWLTYFRMEGPGIAQLERQCQLSDEILRQLVLKLDSRIADAIMQHITESESAAAAEA